MSSKFEAFAFELLNNLKKCFCVTSGSWRTTEHCHNNYPSQLILPAIASCIIKKFILDFRFFEDQIAMSTDEFPITIQMNNTQRNVTCSFCKKMHKELYWPVEEMYLEELLYECFRIAKKSWWIIFLVSHACTYSYIFDYILLCYPS